MLKIQDDISAYLSFSHYINGDDPNIQRKATKLKNKSENEIDYKTVYSEPLKMTMDVLENSTDAIYMYLHSLPETI